LPYSNANLTVSLTTSAYSTWKLYSDALCKNEVPNKIINLNVGLNEYYVKVTAQNGITSKVYALVITRAYMSTACNIISCTNPVIPAGQVGSSTILATAAYSVNFAVIDVTTSPYSTWKLYTNAACLNEVTDKTLVFNVGENMAYIKVTAEDGITTKVYKLIVYRSEPSNSCDIVSVSTPIGATILPNSIVAGISSTTSKIYNINVTVSTNATWKLYSDSNCSIEITTKTLNTPNNLNTAYIKVIAEDGITAKLYTLTVYKYSTACDITSVISPTSASIESTTITAGVPTTNTSVVVNVTTSTNSTWDLYSDYDCLTPLVGKTISLNMGSNIAYIKVVAQDGFTSKVYMINILRGIAIGDYVVMGKYYDEPIVWRCVDIDSNGPLMLADRILSLKPYDAKGVHPNDPNGDRLNFGSNLWETSNMRIWLNSTATENNIFWSCGNAPTASNVWNGYNAYSGEKGFLADGNFTSTERNLIKIVVQKSILNDNDKLTKAGGTTFHTNKTTISTVLQNYDTAYYQNVSDKMFLLDVKQLVNIQENCSTILGASYYIGRPSKKAVDNSQYTNTYLIDGNNWYYWLRTPDATSTNPSGVRYVYSDGLIYSSTTLVQHLFGVRPAFYMDLKTEMFESGNGSVTTPFIIAPAPKTIDLKSSSLGDPTNVVFPKEGGTHNLAVTYQNNTNQVQNTIFVVAVKKDNRLISAYPTYKTFELSEEYTFSHSIDIPSTIDSTNVEVDFYLWDGLNTMKTKHDTVKNSINNVR
jgi:hypothetical protein